MKAKLAAINPIIAIRIIKNVVFSINSGGYNITKITANLNKSVTIKDNQYTIVLAPERYSRCFVLFYNLLIIDRYLQSFLSEELLSYKTKSLAKQRIASN